MATITQQSATQCLLTLTEAEAQVLAKTLAATPTALQDLVTGWLRAQAATQALADQEVFQARFIRLNKGQQQRVLDLLEGKG